MTYNGQTVARFKGPEVRANKLGLVYDLVYYDDTMTDTTAPSRPGETSNLKATK